MAELTPAQHLLPPQRTALELALAQTSALDLSTDGLRHLWSALLCPDPQLPWLAWALSVEGWSEARSDEARRAMILDSIEIHRRKGTRYAVQRALDLVGITNRLIEWWQQTPPGTPHTFLLDVLLTAAPSGQPLITPERADAIIDIVHHWKPASAHFQARVIVGLGTRTRSAMVTRPAGVTRADAVIQTHHTATAHTRSALALRPAQPMRLSTRPATRIHAQARTRSVCAVRLTQRQAVLLLPTGAPQ